MNAICQECKQDVGQESIQMPDPTIQWNSQKPESCLIWLCNKDCMDKWMFKQPAEFQEHMRQKQEHVMELLEAGFELTRRFRSHQYWMLILGEDAAKTVLPAVKDKYYSDSGKDEYWATQWGQMDGQGIVHIFVVACFQKKKMRDFQYLNTMKNCGALQGMPDKKFLESADLFFCLDQPEHYGLAVDLAMSLLENVQETETEN